MALDDEIIFLGQADEIAQRRYGASILGYGGDGFGKALYQEYSHQSSVGNQKKWITERLKNCFLHAVSPPQWIGEPTWPYHQNQPMVFLHQFFIDASAVPTMQGRFSSGRTVYVFGSKSPPFPADGASHREVYQLVSHDEEGNFTVVEYGDSIAG